jgi:RNA polymerase sigma factor (sigma-70 family)
MFDELLLVGQAFMILSEDERNVLLHRFGFLGEKLSLRTLAKMMNISAERVRQKQEKALYKLEISYDTLSQTKSI